MFGPRAKEGFVPSLPLDPWRAAVTSSEPIDNQVDEFLVIAQLSNFDPLR